MPTYEYVCRAGHAFERFQSINDRPVRRCPKCGKAAKRQIGAGGALLFRGSGFYITDNRSTGYKEQARAESGGGDKKPAAGSKGKGTPSDATPKGDTAKSESAKSESPKAESKPAKKTSSKGKS